MEWLLISREIKSVVSVLGEWCSAEEMKFSYCPLFGGVCDTRSPKKIKDSQLPGQTVSNTKSAQSGSPRPDSALAKRLDNARRRIELAKSKRAEILVKTTEVNKTIDPFLKELEAFEAEASAEENETKKAEIDLRERLEMLKDFQGGRD